MAEIAAARLPGPGGIWTWGVAVDADSQKPRPFVELPPGMNPQDFKGHLDVTYHEEGSDEIKHARIPTKLQLFDEAGERIPLFEFCIYIRSIEGDGPADVGSEQILGFYFADNQNKRIDLNQLIAERIRGNLPEADFGEGEKKRARMRVDVASDKARLLLMKIRQEDQELFVKVSAVNVDVEWWPLPP